MQVVNVWRNNHVYLKLGPNVTMSFSTHDINMSKIKKYTPDITISDKIEKDSRLLSRTTDERSRNIGKSISGTKSTYDSINSETWWTSKPNNKSETNSFSIYAPRASRIKIIKIDRNLAKSKHILDSKNDVRGDNVNIIKKSMVSENVINVKTTRDKEDIALINENISSESNASSVIGIKQTSDVRIHNATCSFAPFSTIPFPVYNPEKELPLVRDEKKILAISFIDEIETLHYPTVSNILATTVSEKSQKIYEFWKAELIARIGEEKFKEHNRVQRLEGKLFHSSIRNILYGTNLSIPDNVQLAIDSISSILNGLEDIKAIDSFVSHKQLFYKGKMECIAMYKGKLCVIDWKRCEKKKYSLFCLPEASLQLAAHIGAVNYSNRYPFTVDHGLLVVGYADGTPGDVYEMTTSNLVICWYKWWLKLKQYYTAYSSKLD